LASLLRSRGEAHHGQGVEEIRLRALLVPRIEPIGPSFTRYELVDHDDMMLPSMIRPGL
jgi:hypothetical protein